MVAAVDDIKEAVCGVTDIGQIMGRPIGDPGEGGPLKATVAAPTLARPTTAGPAEDDGHTAQTAIPKRIAYIWSPQLESLASDLPSNRDRSKYVHSLIRVMDLLDLGDAVTPADLQADGGSIGRDCYATDPYDAVRQGSAAATGGKARVVRPDTELGSREMLERYHTKGYLDQIFASLATGQGSDTGSYGTNTSDSSNSDSSESDYSASCHRSKRRKKKHDRLDRYGLLHDCPTFPTLPDYATHVAAATSTACRLVASGAYDIAINWDGGRHHAHRGKASGFCYVADIQLGIMLLLKEGKPIEDRPPSGSLNGETGEERSKASRKPRVMYLDLDLHYGDGVASAFHSPASFFPYTAPSDSSNEHHSTTRPTAKPKKLPKPPNVLTLSIHHSSPLFFPPPSPLSLLPSTSTTSPFSLSIPLRAYPSARTYAAMWPTVDKIRRAYKPDYVVLQLGVDGLPGDPVGKWGNWSTHGEGGINWVVEKVKGWGVGTVVLGGGGYKNDDAARAWAGATGVLLGRDMSEDIDIPHHDLFTTYAPNYTIEVTPGNVKDENSPEYIREINETYDVLAERITRIVDAL